MAGPGAIAVVVGGTNGDGAAVRGEGDAVSGEILSGFSIDVSTELQPIAVWIALIDAYMAGAGAVAVVVVGTNGDGAAVRGEGDAPSGVVVSGFSIDIRA